MAFKFDSSSTTLIGQEIQGISDETLGGIQSLVSRGFREQIPVKNIAKMLQNSVGLTSRATQGMLNFRASMIKSGTSASVIDRALVKYSQRKVRERARLIARTETMKVLNIGQRSALRQARSRNLLPEDGLKVWILANDEKLCPVCSPFENETIGIDEEFEQGDPPLHPACRCTFGFKQKPNEQMRMVASSGANKKVALVGSSKQQIANQTIGGRALTEFDDMDDLARALEKEIGSDVNKFEFFSANAELKEFRAAASFDPSTRNIFVDSKQSKAIQAALDGKKLGSKEIRGLQNLVHETHHAGSTVAKTILEDGQHFMSLTLEEGLVESKAQAFMRKTFGKSVTHPNYQPLVNAMEFLESTTSGFIDTAYTAVSTESRVKMMEAAVDKWLSSLNPGLTFKTANGNSRSAASLLNNLTTNAKFALAQEGEAISRHRGNAEGLYNAIKKALP